VVKYVFGFGSLVNNATHSYTDTQTAQLARWRRIWVKTQSRETVFLSAMRDPDQSIMGLIARVPDQSWQDLDAREFAYSRVDIRTEVTPPLGDVALYQVSTPAPDQQRGHILQSYLDVVVQGYLHHYGLEGAESFFNSTHGWHFPVLNDRAAPRYPRACALSAQEIKHVDDLMDAHAITRI